MLDSKYCQVCHKNIHTYLFVLDSIVFTKKKKQLLYNDCLSGSINIHEKKYLLVSIVNLVTNLIGPHLPKKLNRSTFLWMSHVTSFISPQQF